MTKVGIVGISGYSGGKLLSILLKHPKVRVTYASANNTTGPIDDIWPNVAGLTNLVCEKFDLDNAIREADVFFLAVPHTIAMSIAPYLLKAGKKVIDLSGDYRLDDQKQYQNWYKADHTDQAGLAKAVYGLPELYRADIQTADFIANPGCYPTAALLGIAPLTTLVDTQIDSITIDAKSGISGAGKKGKVELSFGELNQNFKAYKLLNHQHAPEIDLYLSKIFKSIPEVDFVPHLLPIHAGILETIYVRTSTKVDPAKVHENFHRFYKTEPFVRVHADGIQPEIKHVVNSNYCDIGVTISPNQQLIVITSVIDNLMKGAASQAVQNFNIMMDYDEGAGL